MLAIRFGANLTQVWYRTNHDKGPGRNDKEAKWQVQALTKAQQESAKKHAEQVQTAQKQN